MDVVLDFCSYYIPPGRLLIKEFCIIYLPSETHSKPEIIINGLFEPPYQWNKLPESYQQYYREHRDIDKILWDQGYLDIKLQSIIMIENLMEAKTVYVKDKTIKRHLKTIMPYGTNESIICLRNIGYKFPDKFQTNCPNHTKSTAYCVIENAKLMRDWILGRTSDSEKPSINPPRQFYVDEDQFNEIKLSFN